MSITTVSANSRYTYSDVVTLFFQYGSDSKTILEIGCGSGNNLVFFSEIGCQTYGIDLDSRAVLEARDHLASKNLEADVRCGDVIKLPYEDGTFDLVLDRACMQHNQIDSIKLIISEVKRVLREGGLFMICNIRSREDDVAADFKKDKSFKHYEYVHFVNEEELRSLLEGFDIIYLQHRKEHHIVPEEIIFATYLVIGKKCVSRN